MMWRTDENWMQRCGFGGDTGSLNGVFVNGRRTGKSWTNSMRMVSGVLSSSNLVFTSRSECLLELLDGYVVYKLDLRSCAFIDINGGTHEQGFDINGFEQGYRNKVIGTVCRDTLVDEAKFIAFKLVDFIKPEVITYRFLIEGFCNAGDLIEACKLFNLMADQGIGIDVCSVEKLMETMHKQNQFSEAFKLFQAMSVKYSCNLGLSTYKILIHWLCKRGIKADNATLSYLVYGHLAKSRISEAYGVLEGIEKPEISIYHGLIKGLLRLKKPSEATQVFRAMIRQGCEPTMHTYIMLLQGHMGKRGRKGDDPLVNFDTILVGGLVNAGKSLEATKYVERVKDRRLEVPRFDYNKCLHYYSNDEGVLMFEDTELIAAAKADPIAPFTTALIDGINQSEIKRRALMLLCLAHFNANVRDAFLLSVDGTRFDIVGRVPSSKLNECGSVNYQWKEFRVPLKQEACDIGTFCEQLVFWDDHVFLVCYINNFFMFSLPRLPEIADLDDKVNFKGRGMLRMEILRNLGELRVF